MNPLKERIVRNVGLADPSQPAVRMPGTLPDYHLLDIRQSLAHIAQIETAAVWPASYLEQRPSFRKQHSPDACLARISGSALLYSNSTAASTRIWQSIRTFPLWLFRGRPCPAYPAAQECFRQPARDLCRTCQAMPQDQDSVPRDRYQAPQDQDRIPQD